MSHLTTHQIRGRYAPSPTGTLHMGNLQTALLAWLFTRVQYGRFTLRIEDLDHPRVRPGATDQMLNDLIWLGLDWDEGPDVGGPYAPYIQSERLPIYQYYLQLLQDKGFIYPCYCSRAEIASATSEQVTSEEGPRYPGTCRNLTNTQRQTFEASGRRPSLRFRVEHVHPVTFQDKIVGTTSQPVQQLVGDFIVRRSDNIFSYQFAVVVDDALMHINQVVRGSDLLTSTTRQILLYKALKFSIPEFAHVPLLLDEMGKKLSKRTQSMGLAPLQDMGTIPAQIVGTIATRCGLLEEASPISAQELLQHCRPGGTRYMIAALQNVKQAKRETSQ